MNKVRGSEGVREREGACKGGKAGVGCSCCDVPSPSRRRGSNAATQQQVQQCDAAQGNAVQCDVMRCDATQCSAMQRSAQLTAVLHERCDVARLATRRRRHINHDLASLRRQRHDRHEAAGALEQQQRRAGGRALSLLRCSSGSDSSSSSRMRAARQRCVQHVHKKCPSSDAHAKCACVQDAASKPAGGPAFGSRPCSRAPAACSARPCTLALHQWAPLSHTPPGRPGQRRRRWWVAGRCSTCSSRHSRGRGSNQTAGARSARRVQDIAHRRQADSKHAAAAGHA